jgi:hypothetical protein
MKVGFYIKEDLKKEIIKSGVFSSMDEAIEVFAKMKGFTAGVFLSLYAVIKMVD